MRISLLIIIGVLQLKFKIIFISFNILLVFSFLIIFLLPVFMLGSEYALQFLQSSWWVAVIFLVILVFINLIYFLNRRILTYLEDENWPELKILLEQKIFSENKTRKMFIRLYISTCIATSAVDDISLLEKRFRKDNPKALKDWALQLGLPHLLKNDARGMKDYFGEFISLETDDAKWIKWNYCFALLLLRETEEAVVILKSLAEEKKDSLLRLSSLYMLSPFSGEEDVKAILENGRSELSTSMTRDLFARELDKQKDNVQTLFLSKILSEAVDWLYSEQE